ncbi:MAG: hypothetical protein M1825_000648 [Sarcosagium campestre]|nr:MAG: hypothetical protein M1825_000648 [Sarcosagium campestre]
MAKLHIPTITLTDLQVFHAAHFPQPASAAEPLEELNRSLGYYADGRPRTLTDEQIAIFRHSEIHALRQARERALALGISDTEQVDSSERPSTSSPLKPQIQGRSGAIPIHSPNAPYKDEVALKDNDRSDEDEDIDEIDDDDDDDEEAYATFLEHERKRLLPAPSPPRIDEIDLYHAHGDGDAGADVELDYGEVSVGIPDSRPTPEELAERQQLLQRRRIVYGDDDAEEDASQAPTKQAGAFAWPTLGSS